MTLLHNFAEQARTTINAPAVAGCQFEGADSRYSWAAGATSSPHPGHRPPRVPHWTARPLHMARAGLAKGGQG